MHRRESPLNRLTLILLSIFTFTSHSTLAREFDPSLSSLEDPANRNCGQYCLYSKANSNVSLQALYTYEQVRAFDEEVKTIREKTDTNERNRDGKTFVARNLGEFCSSAERQASAGWDDCYKRYKRFQTEALYEARNSIGVQNVSIESLRSKPQIVYTSGIDRQVVAPNPVLGLDESGLKPILPYVPTLKDLNARFLRSRAAPRGDLGKLTSEEYRRFADSIKYAPKEEDFIKFKAIPRDPSFPQSEKIWVRDQSCSMQQCRERRKDGTVTNCGMRDIQSPTQFCIDTQAYSAALEIFTENGAVTKEFQADQKTFVDRKEEFKRTPVIVRGAPSAAPDALGLSEQAFNRARAIMVKTGQEALVDNGNKPKNAPVVTDPRKTRNPAAAGTNDPSLLNPQLLVEEELPSSEVSSAPGILARGSVGGVSNIVTSDQQVQEVRNPNGRKDDVYVNFEKPSDLDVLIQNVVRKP